MTSTLRNTRRIFSFTFTQHIRKKGYRNLTIILALICLIVPALIMSVIELTDEVDEGPVLFCKADTIHVVDLSPNPTGDYSLLNMLSVPGYSEFIYKNFGTDFEKAIDESGDKTLVLYIAKQDENYVATVVLPDGSELDLDDAEAYRRFIFSSFQYVLFDKSGLDTSEIMNLTTPVMSEVVTGIDTHIDEEEVNYDPAREILSFVLPYLNIMTLYFMILFYGQGVANSVIMEKTSKLMDTFLISVKPAAMVMGKVFSIALAGLLQLAIWIISIILSFTAGTHIVKAINPNTDMGLIKLFDSLSIFSGIFSLPTVIIAVLITLSGFLLYCSLSAIGGSLANKPEDLSSTNILFSMTLILSFVIAMNVGGVGLVSSKEWLNYFPFTSFLITPSRVILGEITVLTALVSLAITIAISIVFMLLAGKIYTMMSLYKGNPPSIRKVIEMMR